VLRLSIPPLLSKLFIALFPDSSLKTDPRRRPANRRRETQKVSAPTSLLIALLARLHPVVSRSYFDASAFLGANAS
jgi:hypothetical protein